MNGIGNTNQTSHDILDEKDIQVPARLLQEVDSRFIEDMGGGCTPDFRHKK